MDALLTNVNDPEVQSFIDRVNQLAPDGVATPSTVLAAYTPTQLGRLGGAEERLLREFPENFAMVPDNLSVGWDAETVAKLNRLRQALLSSTSGVALGVLEAARHLGWAGDLLSFGLTYMEAESRYREALTVGEPQRSALINQSNEI